VPAGQDQIFTAKTFPGSPHMVSWHPTATGAMSTRTGPAGSMSFVGDPFGFQPATFTTDPFKKDTLITGVPQLSLAASMTMPMTYLIGNLYEESPDGKLRRLSVFAINPVLRNGLDKVSPVTPGERYMLHPPGWPMAQNVLKGDRLVLQISTADSDKFPFFSIDPNVQIFTGRGGTTLQLPVIDNPVLYEDNLPLK
jgi:predicted acyl esterase